MHLSLKPECQVVLIFVRTCNPNQFGYDQKICKLVLVTMKLYEIPNYQPKYRIIQVSPLNDHVSSFSHIHHFPNSFSSWPFRIFFSNYWVVWKIKNLNLVTSERFGFHKHGILVLTQKSICKPVLNENSLFSVSAITNSMDCEGCFYLE